MPPLAPINPADSALRWLQTGCLTYSSNWAPDFIGLQTRHPEASMPLLLVLGRCARYYPATHCAQSARHRLGKSG
jgi:hypothetical protein